MSTELILTPNEPKVLTNTDRLSPSDLVGIVPSFRENIIFIDNTAIEVITTCPWKAYATLIQRRRLADPSPALIFGSHIHTALDYHYRELALGRHPDISYQLSLLESCFDKEGTGEDWRSLGLAQEVVRKYALEHTIEPFDVVILPDGKPAVELPFAIYLGEVEGIMVVYMGKIDTAIRATNTDQLFIMDHKTTSMLGDGFWRDANMSPQQRGYCYAYRECYGIEPHGYIINAIACRKPTKTGTQIEFQRQHFYTKFPNSQLDEWKINCLAQVRAFIRYIKDNYFPRHYAMHCESKYGKCPFYEVCEVPEGERMEKLMGPQYKLNEWSPLKHS